MPTVSLPFVLMIGLLATVAGILNLAAPNPVYDMAALLLALYAVHGLGLRLAWRRQDDTDETREKFEELQAELDRERATLEAERAERSELESQWIGLASARDH